eukprot:803847-Prymnesium_polylepis.1
MSAKYGDAGRSSTVTTTPSEEPKRPASFARASVTAVGWAAGEVAESVVYGCGVYAEAAHEEARRSITSHRAAGFGRSSARPAKDGWFRVSLLPNKNTLATSDPCMPAARAP